MVDITAPGLRPATAAGISLAAKTSTASRGTFSSPCHALKQALLISSQKTCQAGVKTGTPCVRPADSCSSTKASSSLGATEMETQAAARVPAKTRARTSSLAHMCSGLRAAPSSPPYHGLRPRVSRVPRPSRDHCRVDLHHVHTAWSQLPCCQPNEPGWIGDVE